jgi:hypothetical protein
MNPRTTGILVLVAAALGAFVYLYEIRGAQSRTEAEEKQKRLFADVEAAAIQWIELDAADGSPPSRIERADGKWRLTAPLAFPADTGVADGLASTLATLSSESELENPQPPDEYGLGAGARVVRFAAGDAEHTLRLGRDAPVGGGAYASAGGDAIYTVPRFKATSLAKRADELRDKRILEFEPASVERIEASWPPDGRVVLEREAAAAEAAEDAKDGEDAEAPAEPERAWRVVEPMQGRADPDTVSDLLSDLSFLQADGFVDAPPADADAGLATPDYRIALTLPGVGEGAEKRVVRMDVGTRRDGDVRWVRGAQPSLYVIPAARIDDMPRKLSAYRWKQLARFPVPDAASADFFFQPPSGDPVVIHAERSGDAWTSGPEAFAEGKLDAAIAELSRLRAADIVADSMGEKELAKLGLAPPNAIITVFGKPAEGGDAEAKEQEKSAPILAEVQIGNVEGSEWIFARAAGDPTVYRLPYSLAEQLPVSLDAFRNRFLAPEAPEADAQKPAEDAQPAPDGADFPSPSEESP